MNKKASILVMAMWVLMFFSIINTMLYSIASSQINVTKKIRTMFIAQYLAKAACVHAQTDRYNDNTDYDTLYELRTLREKELGRGKFQYSIVDEESKININKISKKVLSSLPGFSDELADNILDSEEYPFHLKEELLHVDGVTMDIYEGIKEMITVYGNGSVNINTASSEVFNTLGMDSGLIDIISNYRNGPDSEPATEDDAVFKSTDKILEQLQEFTSLFVEQQILIMQLKNKKLLGVSSTDFTLQIDTEVYGKSAMGYKITMDKQKIKQWREN